MTLLTPGARRPARILAALVASFAISAAAGAQTVTLTHAADTTVRGGSYANTNFGAWNTLATRASTNNEYKRRVLLKFDTHTTIAAGASVASAKLTLTVKGGNAQTRTLTAYRVPQAYNHLQATWNIRTLSARWSTAGGDIAERIGQATVTGVVGSKVLYDVTAVLRKIVGGTYGSSRYLRVLLVDEGSSTNESYKEFYSMETGSQGPTLVVTLGATPPPPPPPTLSSGSTLKVMDWNIHHGVDTSNASNLTRVATWIANINPHVVSLNEVERLNGWANNTDQPAVLVSLLKSKTGVSWYKCFAQISGAVAGQGNLILSRIPIQSCSDYILSYTRSVAHAKITVNGRTVNVFSTHIDDSSSGRRATQMDQLKNWASGFAEQRVVAGDFNTYPSAGEIARITGTYYDVWAKAQSAGTAIAYPGNTAGNTRNSRIDYIFYSKGATGLALKSAQVYNTGSVSDHRPVVATFEVR